MALTLRQCSYSSAWSYFPIQDECLAQDLLVKLSELAKSAQERPTNTKPVGFTFPECRTDISVKCNDDITPPVGCFPLQLGQSKNWLIFRMACDFFFPLSFSLLL